MLSIAALAPAALNFGGIATPKKAPAAFAYGLPGNFNALGGAELNFDPAGFLKARAQKPALAHLRTLIRHVPLRALAHGLALTRARFVHCEHWRRASPSSR